MRSGELTFADTSAMSGYITFSTRALEAGLRDGCESGYEAEQPLVARYCNGKKEEHLFWLLLHEFTHLIGGASIAPLSYVCLTPAIVSLQASITIGTTNASLIKWKSSHRSTCSYFPRTPHQQSDCFVNK